MAYEVMLLAKDVSLELRAEIGASASSYSCEEDFLRGTVEYLDELLEDPGVYLARWNLLKEKDVETFAAGVRRMKSHLLETLDTPVTQRGPVGW